jgi:hypothetical protein
LQAQNCAFPDFKGSVNAIVYGHTFIFLMGVQRRGPKKVAKFTCIQLKNGLIRIIHLLRNISKTKQSC